MRKKKRLETELEKLSRCMFLEHGSFKKIFLLGWRKIVLILRSLILLLFSVLRVLLCFHIFFIPVSLTWLYNIEMENIYKHDLVSLKSLKRRCDPITRLSNK